MPINKLILAVLILGDRCIWPSSVYNAVQLSWRTSIVMTVWFSLHKCVWFVCVDLLNVAHAACVFDCCHEYNRIVMMARVLFSLNCTLSRWMVSSVFGTEREVKMISTRYC